MRGERTSVAGTRSYAAYKSCRRSPSIRTATWTSASPPPGMSSLWPRGPVCVWVAVIAMCSIGIPVFPEASRRVGNRVANPESVEEKVVAVHDLVRDEKVASRVAADLLRRPDVAFKAMADTTVQEKVVAAQELVRDEEVASQIATNLLRRPEVAARAMTEARFSELAALDEARQRLHVSAIAVIVRDGDSAIDARRGSENSFHAPRGQRQRTFAHHVTFRRERAEHVRLM